MADTFTFTSPGQKVGGSDAKELFLKLYSGETLMAYERKTTFAARTKRATISRGKQYQWPATGRVTASRATPGVEANGQSTSQNEVTIGLDPAIQVPLFFDDFYAQMEHFDTRSAYAMASGEALAVQEDQDISKEIVKASKTAAIVGVGHDFGGSVIVSDKFKIQAGGVGSADVAEQALALYEALFLAAQTFAEKNVPLDEIFCCINAARYFNMVKAIQSNGFSLSSKDYFPSAADLNNGTLPRLAGIQILWSNLLPTTDTSGSDTYHGVNAAKTVGVIWRSDAVGTLILNGLQVKVQEQVRALGTYMTTFYLKGHGVLRPSSAISLELSTLSN
jgi:hypothetical protein